MTTVSVIIPNYNQAHFLSAAIQSVLHQKYPAHEIIVVDDGSNDASREVVDQFSGRVRYIRQENRGLAGARNTGIQASAGELIGLLDADDEWAPDFLESMVALAEENPNAPVFYCMAQCMDVNGNDLPQSVGGPPVPYQNLHQYLLRHNFIIPSTVLFRREPIVKAGMFDAALRSCEDWDLWLRLLPNRKLIGSPKSLVRYRVHGSSLSTNVQGMQDATKKVVEKHYGLDDGKFSLWTPEKRRMYGGMYRYQALTFVQRQENWNAAESSFCKALLIDPSLALDLEFFYELALGSQPVGYRGTGTLDRFGENASHTEKMVRDVSVQGGFESIRRTVLGTCNFALGLVCYNLGVRSESRGYFLKALFHRPELVFDIRLTGNLLKSFIRRDDLVKIKKFLRSAP